MGDAGIVIALTLVAVVFVGAGCFLVCLTGTAAGTWIAMMEAFGAMICGIAVGAIFLMIWVVIYECL